MKIPLHFCLENPTDRGAWRATVLGAGDQMELNEATLSLFFPTFFINGVYVSISQFPPQPPFSLVFTRSLHALGTGLVCTQWLLTRRFYNLESVPLSCAARFGLNSVS